MATRTQTTARKQQARTMLSNGFSMASIARRLAVHHNTVFRWIHQQDEDGLVVTASARDITRDAKAKIAIMLTKIGLSQTTIGDYLQIKQSWVSQLLSAGRKEEPQHGNPQLPILMKSTVYLSHGNILPDNSRWIATPFTSDSCMMRRIDGNEVVLEVPYAYLIDNISVEQQRHVCGSVDAIDTYNSTT